FLVMFLSG
uniref:Sex pheromone cPD1 n=1 Tax=Enterococcus faecalis TaxID=1351 RepID=CPD1_ENTFL|nr:RecName: Full=Sex pheromone cPD1 [Enterococcus faecalis]